MSTLAPLSAEAKVAGHRLYQILYGPVAEQVPLTLEQAQAAIDRLATSAVTDYDMIRAAMAEANYYYWQASDDFSSMDHIDDIFEPSARMLANADVVGLLEDAQMARQDAQIARQDAESAVWDAKFAEWEAESARQDAEYAKWEAKSAEWEAEDPARSSRQQ